MSYTKHTGTDGETITAAKLNNIENGIEAAGSSTGGVGFLNLIVAEFSLDKTWQEIYDASLNSVIALTGIGEEDEYYSEEATFMDNCYYDPNNADNYPYFVVFMNGNFVFRCDSPDEYPTQNG